MPGPELNLREALATAAAALQDGDVAALDAAVRAGVELCARLGAAGAAPPAPELRQLIEIHRAVLHAAEERRDRLGEELARAARSRQAASTYAGR